MLCYIFFYPETKGRTLEQMDELFGDQLVPHALIDSEGARAAMEKDPSIVHQVEEVHARNGEAYELAQTA